MEKTVLLFCPHLVKSSAPAWQLMHLAKEKNIPHYKTETLSRNAIKKYFPSQPPAFSTSLMVFSEKQLNERKLYQDLMALKPFLSSVPCYHQVPLPVEKNRFKTVSCRFNQYIPDLRFSVQRHSEGYYFLETEIQLMDGFHPYSSFIQTDFLIAKGEEYFFLRFADYKTISWVAGLDWKQQATDMSAFAENILSRIEKDYTVVRNSLIETQVVDVIPQCQVMLSELSGQFLMITPRFEYDGFIIDGPFQEDENIFNEGKEYTIKRKKEEETGFLTGLTKLHPLFEKQFNGYFYLSFEQAQEKNWFHQTCRYLISLDTSIVGMDMLKHFRYNSQEPVTQLKAIKEVRGSLEVSFSLHFGKEEVKFSDLQKIVRAGQNAIPLKDGSIGLLDEEWLGRYGIIVKHAIHDKDGIAIPKWIAIALEENEDSPQVLPAIMKQEWRQKWHQWQSTGNFIYPLPDTVNAELRSYQQKGYEWMRLLDEAGAGIFLADDMGLGKTLQTICFASYIVSTNPLKKILIVSPASLIYNWQNEWNRFAPSVNVFIYHGSNKSIDVFMDEKVQVIITTYGTLRTDGEIFLSYEFSTIVLDESHTIKNAAAQVSRRAHALSADRKVVLSGTPVMNNTFDLFSQLHFILPGMFGSREFFKKEYADPIDRFGNEQRIKDLKRLTTPFILRRTKEQVAKDLPPKTEIILWCRMEEAQQQVYDEVRNRIKGEIRASLDEKGLQKAKLQVLQGILKLRQVCNSPELLNDIESTCTDSIKTTELLEEIENNLSNHKALVFSQFTSMLNILSAELSKRNIPHLMLTGSTAAKERERLVQEFNNDEGPSRVFLLSLKAGNAGLNLVSADYVFLFDPWWNSAVEQQAIDRTHRIGQTKSVFAYKLICKDSIEEKIIQLQQRKKNLAGELISEEEGFVKNLTEEDIEFLFG